jgi:uncharacterized protein involved in outer membrane biogenesis
MRFRKTIFIIGIVICSLLLLVFLFISPIVKYVVEKHSEEWIGRKIKLENFWINIFTGSVHVRNFHLLENKSEKDFIRIADFYCNVALLKIPAGKYKIETIRFTKPEINIVQRGNHFNFDDLLMHFADTTGMKSKSSTEPVKYFIENFSIDSASINYSNTHPAASISLINLNVSSAPVAYTDSVFNIASSFGFKTGGNIAMKFQANAKSMAYRMELKTQELNISFLLSYLKDYMKVKSLDGLVTTDMIISGDLNKSTDVCVTGTTSVNNFSLIDKKL